MSLSYHISAQTMTLVLKGDYIDYENESDKSRLLHALKSANVKHIDINGQDIGKWDSTLVVVLFELLKDAQHKKIAVNLNSLPEGLQRLLHLAVSVTRRPEQPHNEKESFLPALGSWGLMIFNASIKGLHFIHQALRSLGRFLRHKATMRHVDFLFALEDCSYRAIPIVSLISFMVGLILAFVGAVQLKLFGAQIYVASLVAIGMTRIMGAIMIGIIMAGRTGASYAATIGTMQVNEEIDALKTMGILWSDFLVLPRVLALVITLPFLTMWADFMGMIGGAAVSIMMLDIAPQEYWKYSVQAFTLKNFLVGIFHGFVFAWIIALCGCYYGIYCGRNANSVGVATTKAVVSAIVWMIVATGIITWAFEVMGI